MLTCSFCRSPHTWKLTSSAPKQKLPKSFQALFFRTVVKFRFGLDPQTPPVFWKKSPLKEVNFWSPGWSLSYVIQLSNVIVVSSISLLGAHNGTDFLGKLSHWLNRYFLPIPLNTNIYTICIWFNGPITKHESVLDST